MLAVKKKALIWDGLFAFINIIIINFRTLTEASNQLASYLYFKINLLVKKVNLEPFLVS